MKTKITILITLWIFIQHQGIAQPSFFKELVLPNGSSITDFSYNNICTDDSGFSISFLSDSAPFTDSLNVESAVILVELDLLGNVINSSAIENPDFLFTTPIDFVRNGPVQAMIVRETLDSIQLMMLVANTQNNTVWGKRLTLDLVPYTNLDFDSNGNIVASYYHDSFINNVSPPKLGISSHDPITGNSLFEYYYQTQLPANIDRYRTFDLEGQSNGNISILGLAGNSSNPNYFILQLDSDGSILQSAGTDDSNFQPRQLISDELGNLYIAGRYHTYPDLGNFGYTCFIAKLDSNLDLIWSKEIDIENFNCSGLKINCLPNGDLFFTYLTNGNIPAILGKFSADGSLLWYKAYNFFLPKMDLSAAGGPVTLSKRKYLPDGSFSDALMISGLDTDGNIDGCAPFSSCVNLKDFDFNLSQWSWQKEPGAALSNISLNLHPLSLSTIDYCEPQILPSPNFEIPDTICVEDCIEPFGLNNSNASVVNWIISGPELDTTIIDTTFNFCFDQAGNYLIEQVIWSLGCTEFFTTELVVLPPLNPVLNTSGFICSDTPFELSVSANRSLQEIIWSDGSTNESIFISESGPISVTVRDQYCETTIFQEIIFLNDSINETIFQLPSDTIICETQLPWTLQVSSPYTEDFELLETGETGINFELIQAGTYTLFTEIEDCPFFTNYRLEVDPCYGYIYLPNAFSPNNDGINDLWQAYGPDIELKSLQIFDRWGGLIYSDYNAPISWDGTGVENKKVNPGTYVFLINYETTFDGKTYQESGDILILK